MRAFRLVGAAAVWLLVAASARADVIFQYVSNVSNVTLGPGGTATVNLYLQETDTKGSPSLLAAENGLFGAGVVVTQARGTGGHLTTIAAIAGNTLPDPSNIFTTPAPGFNGQNLDVVSNGNRTGSILEAVSPNVGANGIGGPSGTTTGGSVTTTGSNRVTDVFLGTVTFTGGDALTSTTFSLLPASTLGGGDQAFSFLNAFDLDGSSGNPAYVGANTFIAAPFQITLATVPEPSTLCIGALGAVSGMGLGAWRRWRLRRTAARA